MCRSSAIYSHLFLIYWGLSLCRIPQTYHLYALNTVLHQRLYFTPGAALSTPPRHMVKKYRRQISPADYDGIFRNIWARWQRRFKKKKKSTCLPAAHRRRSPRRTCTGLGSRCGRPHPRLVCIAQGPCGRVLEFCRGKTWLGRLTCLSDRYCGSDHRNTVPQRQKGA